MAGLTMTDFPDGLGHILKAMLDGPPGAHAFEPGRDEMSSCPGCGTPWDDCDASQPYADGEDAPCCDVCVHEWVPPPPSYAIASAYEAYMTEIGLGRDRFTDSIRPARRPAGER